jgi:hypothetical protein
MGFYPIGDGRWFYLHCNFPNHRAAALSVLGVAEDREAVARAVAIWNAADLEEAGRAEIAQIESLKTGRLIMVKGQK